ncbi:DNA polymerase IV [bacterium]|nr:DNA polymerase IV [bacterium]
MRKIIHVDMDAFYASVEQRDDPRLRGRPVAVGGAPEGRGVVAAASYEARRFGVRSAMPAAQAKAACPELIFVRPRIAIYRRVSRVVMAVLREYSERVEPLALDEAYLDVTTSKKPFRYASVIARELRARIADLTGLSASAGVAPNKFLAKLASEMAKPDGLRVIRPEEVEGLLPELSVRVLPGVGPKTERKMAEYGVQKIAHLREFSEARLTELFGKQGAALFSLARGEDPRGVVVSRPRKSISTERTFAEDLRGEQAAKRELVVLAEELEHRLQTKEVAAHGITLKVTYHDFTKVTRSTSFSTPVSSSQELLAASVELLGRTEISHRPARLLGIAAHQLHAAEKREERQLLLWE